MTIMEAFIVIGTTHAYTHMQNQLADLLLKDVLPPIVAASAHLLAVGLGARVAPMASKGGHRIATI